MIFLTCHNLYFANPKSLIFSITSNFCYGQMYIEILNLELNLFMCLFLFNCIIKTIRKAVRTGPTWNSVPAGLLCHGTQCRLPPGNCLETWRHSTWRWRTRLSVVTSQALVVLAKFKGKPLLVNGFLTKELLHTHAYKQKILTLAQWSREQWK